MNMVKTIFSDLRQRVKNKQASIILEKVKKQNDLTIILEEDDEDNSNESSENVEKVEIEVDSNDNALEEAGPYDEDGYDISDSDQEEIAVKIDEKKDP